MLDYAHIHSLSGDSGSQAFQRWLRFATFAFETPISEFTAVRNIEIVECPLLQFLSTEEEAPFAETAGGYRAQQVSSSYYKNTVVSLFVVHTTKTR